MLHYCKKCGRLILRSGIYGEPICDRCQSVVYPVPQEFLVDGTDFIMKKDREQEFIDKYIKTAPEFDQYLFDHKDELPTNLGVRLRNLEEAANAVQHKNNPAGVKCPYCQSMSVKRISGVRRFASVELFGIASKKIGKQWHCNDCGSDF